MADSKVRRGGACVSACVLMGNLLPARRFRTMLTLARKAQVAYDAAVANAVEAGITGTGGVA